MQFYKDQLPLVLTVRLQVFKLRLHVIAESKAECNGFFTVQFHGYLIPFFFQ